MKAYQAEAILNFHSHEIKDAPCSVKHHLNVRGGLIQHLYHVAAEAVLVDLYDQTLYGLALIHDIGKSRTYKISKHIVAGVEEDKIEYATPAVDHLINTVAMIEEASGETGYHLTQEELHALQFHHGGWSPFAHRVSLTELAVKLHYCDMLATVREDCGYYEPKHI